MAAETDASTSFLFLFHRIQIVFTPHAQDAVVVVVLDEVVFVVVVVVVVVSLRLVVIDSNAVFNAVTFAFTNVSVIVIVIAIMTAFDLAI